MLYQLARSSFPLSDYALLLGAIYGDGYIQERGKRSWKVAMTVGDKYPAWLAEVRRLYDSVFGRRFEYEKKINGRGRFFEIYVTTHDLHSTFRISSKYDELKRLVPPAWIDGDPELKRQFCRGLVETDGSFAATHDRRYSGEWARFIFAQKCPHLTEWFAAALREQNVAPRVDWHGQAGTWQVCVQRQAEVARLGEWLESFKWQALLASGFDPQLGRNVTPEQSARFWPDLDRDTQMEWRRLREAGASITAIARHFGRANSVVHVVVKDIVPERCATGASLGLVTKPRYPKASRVPFDEVKQWRELAGTGVSAIQIAKKFGRSSSMVTEATCDILNQDSS